MDLDFKPRTGNDKDTAKPQFFLEPIHMVFKSTEAGRPIYEDREFVRIITPGAARSIPVEEVTDEHKARWTAEYKIFKEGLEEAPVGTPLEKWPPMTPSMCLNLKAIHIRTVEELAQAGDNMLNDIGLGARQFRDRAKDFLALAAEQEPIAAAQARADQAEARTAALEAQVAALTAAQAEAPRRGPGRPPKTVEPHFQDDAED